MDQTVSATHGEIVIPIILTAFGIHCLLQVLKNIFPLGQKEINAWSELLRNKWQIIEIIKKQIRADSKKPISFLFNNHLILISFCVGYDMSTFIRRYGRYLNEKAFAYRQMAFDFTRVKKGYGKHGVHAVAHSNTCLAISIFFYMFLLSVWLKSVALLLCKILSLLCYLSADGVMRTMTTEKLLKGMPVLQTQIDTLLEFDVRLCFDLHTFSLFFFFFIYLDEQNLRQPYLSLSCLLSGSSQGAEQWDHQCCISASLQGLGETVCILQWWDHQPIRLVVHLKWIDCRIISLHRW